MKKKFLIITGSRSEFGLIKTLVKRLTKLNYARISLYKYSNFNL